MTDTPTPPSTFAELLAAFVTLLGKFTTLFTQEQNWATGTATGGPNGDGTYPFTMPDGTVFNVPSPACSAARVAEMDFVLQDGLVADEVVYSYRTRVAFTMPANLAGAVGQFVGDPPTSAVTLKVYRRRGDMVSEIGSITIGTDKALSFAGIGSATAPILVGDLVGIGGNSDPVPFDLLAVSLPAALA